MKDDMDLKFPDLDDELDLRIPSKEDIDNSFKPDEKDEILKNIKKEIKGSKDVSKKIIKKESKKGTGKKTIIIILLILLIGMTIFGFWYLYNNYIDVGCSTKEECFYEAIQECKPYNYTKQHELLTFISYTEIDVDYQIIGRSEQGTCYINIEKTRATTTYEKYDIFRYLDDNENRLKVYEQVVLFSKSNPENNFFKDIRLDWSPSSINEVINKFKDVIEMHFNEMDINELQRIQRSKNDEVQNKVGKLEECEFESSDKLYTFIQNHIKRSTLSSTYDEETTNEFNIKTTYYNGGKCVIKTPI